MKISQNTLVEAVKELRKIVPKSPAIAAFACIKVSLDAQGTHLEATDGIAAGTIHATASILAPTTGLAAKIAALRAARESGSVLIDADVLLESAKLADVGSELDITSSDIHLQINGQLTTIPTGGYDVANFPASTPVNRNGFRLDSKAIKLALPFASKDKTRQILNSVYWDKNQIIATDGRRLHMEEANLECPRPTGAIFPIKICQLIPETCDVHFQGETASVSYNLNSLNVRLTFQLQERYPNYQQVIPEASGNSFTINHEECLSRLKRIISSTKAGVGLKITPSANAVTFCIQIENGIQVPFTLPAIIKGAPQPTSFDPSFIIQALEAKVNTFDMKDGTSPARITGARGKLHVAMPMASPYRKKPTTQPTQQTTSQPQTQPHTL